MVLRPPVTSSFSRESPSKKFAYLGIELSVRGLSFSRHVQERVRKARQAFGSIPKPSSLSLATVIKLFDLKIAPIASYGIQVVWRHLSQIQLEELGKLKTALLKIALCLHRSARNRLVLQLTNTRPLSLDLQEKYGLPDTEASVRQTERWKRKNAYIDPGFFLNPAMISDAWKAPQFRSRHKYTRGATHGSHFEICSRSHSHEIDCTCICKYCRGNCDLYHFYSCQDAQALNSLIPEEEG